MKKINKTKIKKESNNLKVQYTPISLLRPATYNPRKWNKEAIEQLTESIKRFGLVDPIICNSAPDRENVVIGGHFRRKIVKDLGFEKIPVVYINIPDVNKEKELNVRLNKNLGDWDLNLLTKFDESFLSNVGFTSEELDEVFDIDLEPEKFDLEKELAKLNIYKIKVQKGDIWKLGSHRLMCGDSTNEKDVLKLMNGEKAEFCFTDPPYLLDYLHTKYKGKKPGFGYKRNRKYLETDVLPDDFTEKWMKNIHKIQKEDFSIIAIEN